MVNNLKIFKNDLNKRKYPKRAAQKRKYQRRSRRIATKMKIDQSAIWVLAWCSMQNLRILTGREMCGKQQRCTECVCAAACGWDGPGELRLGMGAVYQRVESMLNELRSAHPHKVQPHYRPLTSPSHLSLHPSYTARKNA